MHTNGDDVANTHSKRAALAGVQLHNAKQARARRWVETGRGTTAGTTELQRQLAVVVACVTLPEGSYPTVCKYILLQWCAQKLAKS